MTAETQAAAAQRLVLTESGIYALVDVSQQIVTLLTLPVFFFFLSVEDFGVITGAVVVSQLTMFLSTVGLDFSLLRSYYVWPEEERVRLTSGIFLVTALWSLAIALLSVWVIDALSDSRTYRLPLILGAWSGLILGVRNVPLSVMRVRGMMRTYAGAEIGAAIGRGASQLVLVALGLGSVGYMVGYAVAPALSLLALLLTARSWLDWRHARWMLPRDLWLYTAKVLPSLIFTRFLAIVDRAILFKWSNLDSLGLYGAASRFSSSLKLFTGGFKMAIAPALSRTEADRAASAEVYSRLSRLLLLTMLCTGSALMLAAWCVQFTPWAASWVQMQRLVGVLLLAQFLGGIALIRQMGTYYSPRPHTASLAAGGSAVVLVAALFLMVPHYGAMGAAAAQIAGAAVNIVLLGALDTRGSEQGGQSWEFLWLTALFVPAIAAMWLVDGRYQLFVLLPTLAVYGAITASTVIRLWLPKPVPL